MRNLFSKVSFRIGLSLLAVGLAAGVVIKYSQPAQSQSRSVSSKKRELPPAQPPVQNTTGPQHGKAVAFAVSPPIRDIVEYPGLAYDKKNSFQFSERERDEEGGFIINEKNREAIRRIDPSVKGDVDGAMRPMNRLFNQAPPPAPSLIINGVTNADNSTLFGGTVNPPDVEGDVGPNHYVQVVNLALRIFDKTTGIPTGPAVKFSSIFTALGAPCGTRDDGDPIVLYDPLADRWLLSQFCLPDANLLPPYYEAIAISQTNDPTGAYYLYAFNVGAGNNEFPDYPHLGVWGDGYYMTTNQFLNGGNFDGAGVFAFDRAKMLLGDPTAGFIYFNRNLSSFPEAQGGLLPADVDGIRPPPAGAACPIAYFTANEFGDPADGVRIFDFHADFTTPANSTLIERPESAAVPGGGIPVAAFNPNVPGTTRDNIPQPPPASNTTARLDAISDRLMHRLQYINYGTSEDLTVTHTVSVGTDTTLANYRAGIRYYNFRRATPGAGPWLLPDQGTFSGAGGDTTSRWMGSAAKNAAGDLAVGYTASSLTVFPSIRYAARFSSDAPGSLAQGETEIFTGLGAQTTTNSRWGDYSALSLDPVDDCTFWYTGETYAASSSTGWITKIAKFNLGTPCNAFPRGTISGTITNCATGNPINAATVKTADGYIRTTGAPGTYSMSVSPGTYTVSATKSGGFTTATSAGNVVTNGGNTVVNLCMGGVPVLAAATPAPTLIGESCQPANGVIDPGEIVVVRFPVKNTGAVDTVNDIGTLQATGGVLLPDGPKSYGVIVAGGADKFVDYQFTASPQLACGTNITATVSHNDAGGAGNLGNIVYTLPTGQTGAPQTTSYTGPAVPIPDNNTTGVNINIPVATTGTIGDLDFRYDVNAGATCDTTIGDTDCSVDHTWIGDLIFTLTSPSGTSVTFVDRIGFPAGLSGNSGNNFALATINDDIASNPIENFAGAPVAGNFTPNNPLSAFDGQPANGNWVLNVSDRAAQDTGSVRRFSLLISTRTCSTNCVLAAGVDVSGRVYAQGGRGLSGAKVILTDQNGSSRTVVSDRQGIFTFTDVEAGRYYTVSIGSRRYEYAPQVIQVVDNVAGLDFHPQE